METAAVLMTCSVPRAAVVGLAQISAPDELRAVAQWVLWRWETRYGRRTKVPYAVRSGSRADVRDVTCHATYRAACQALLNGRGRYAGLGFVFTADDPFCGVDLDGAIGDDGNLLPWARRMVNRLSTYTELSPSGRGAKLFLRASLTRAASAGGNAGDRVRHRRRGLGPDGTGAAEIYDAQRFFTVTGRWLPASPKRVADRQAALDELYGELFPPVRRYRSQRFSAASEVAPADDDAILRRAMAAANAAKFARLWHGDASDYGGDESARDAALCACLAFYTRDPLQLERLVARSGCRRAKWDSRPDYRDRTIRFALATRF